MKRIVLAGLLLLAGCSEAAAADSAECRRWQSDYEGTHVYDHGPDGEPNELGAMLRSHLLEKRPEGCPIP